MIEFNVMVKNCCIENPKLSKPSIENITIQREKLRANVGVKVELIQNRTKATKKTTFIAYKSIIKECEVISHKNVVTLVTLGKYGGNP